ncbi:hypothetical protein VTO73DRAFT_7808 [Trametes versicolor]
MSRCCHDTLRFRRATASCVYKEIGVIRDPLWLRNLDSNTPADHLYRGYTVSRQLRGTPIDGSIAVHRSINRCIAPWVATIIVDICGRRWLQAGRWIERNGVGVGYTGC